MGFAKPGFSLTFQSSLPSSALTASKSPVEDAAKTRLVAVVKVPPPFICGMRQRAVSVTGSHATRYPPGRVSAGGGGAAAPFAGRGGGAGIRNTMPQLYSPSSGLNVEAET